MSRQYMTFYLRWDFDDEVLSIRSVSSREGSTNEFMDVSGVMGRPEVRMYPCIRSVIFRKVHKGKG